MWSTTGYASQASGEASQDASLRRVRVNEAEPLPSVDPVKLPERLQIACRIERIAVEVDGDVRYAGRLEGADVRPGRGNAAHRIAGSAQALHLPEEQVMERHVDRGDVGHL